MCGRFALDFPSEVLSDWYQTVKIPELFKRYNIAPGTEILIIRESAKARKGTMVRWGFIPKWAKKGQRIPMLNNARGETVSTNPIFKPAFKQQRCIIPASGFFEWKALSNEKHKQPFYISTGDGCPVSFAGIWETITINGVTIEKLRHYYHWM
ncbi:SOS response-associated peptidase family protein [Nitrosomonas ureae]|uniref:SOS response-associated peptidase family protein n=1 Tax=Nitrosomonas ureae TaxID=44577 RepID=UPI000BE2DFE0